MRVCEGMCVRLCAGVLMQSEWNLLLNCVVVGSPRERRGKRRRRLVAWLVEGEEDTSPAAGWSQESHAAITYVFLVFRGGIVCRWLVETFSLICSDIVVQYRHWRAGIKESTSLISLWWMDIWWGQWVINPKWLEFLFELHCHLSKLLLRLVSLCISVSVCRPLGI